MLRQINPAAAVLPHDARIGIGVSTAMALGKSNLLEVVRALCVVALVFLNFGHAPLAAGSEYAFSPPANSFCGDPLDDPSEAKDHPCQACRIGAGMALPPASGVVGVLARWAAVLCQPANSFALPNRGQGYARQRAPPLA